MNFNFEYTQTCFCAVDRDRIKENALKKSSKTSLVGIKNLENTQSIGKRFVKIKFMKNKQTIIIIVFNTF